MSDHAPKVLFVLPSLAAGGAERVLITFMNALNRSKFSPAFLSVKNSGSLGALIAPEIETHSLNKERVLLSLPELYKKLKTIKPDVVISTMAHMNFVLLMLKPFFPKTKFIVREAVTPSYFFKNKSLKSLLAYMGYKVLYPFADVVVSPAQRIIDEFRDVLRMRTGNHQLLYNPVDMGRIRSSEGKKFTSPKDSLQLVAAGRLHPQKGFDRLITMLAEADLPHIWALTIYGEGNQRDQLEELINKYGLESNIHLPGHVSSPWVFYAQADCFLLPSRFEGLPNVVLEALACGTPVIATKDSGGISEIEKLTDNGAVTIAQDMNEFKKAVECIVPTTFDQFRPSLLPKMFALNSTVSKLERLIDELHSHKQKPRC